MKGQFLRSCILVLAVALVVACPAWASKNTPSSKPASAHPELSAQEKLTPCSQCHKDATPTVYKEWYNSVHGIDNVKCFQCHGTYEDIKASPDEATCASCHNAQYMKRPKNKKCWDCHPAHYFFIHK